MVVKVDVVIDGGSSIFDDQADRVGRHRNGVMWVAGYGKVFEEAVDALWIGMFAAVKLCWWVGQSQS